MRTRIKVTDLSLGQWDHLQDNLPASYDMPEGAVRVCVEFELDAQMDSRHVEMPVRAFMALMTRLQEVQARAEAALTPDALPPKWSAPLSQPRTCDHGAAVVAETPSAFEGAEPVRDYADGCQSFGPYGGQGWRDEATGLVSGGLVTDEG